MKAQLLEKIDKLQGQYNALADVEHKLNEAVVTLRDFYSNGSLLKNHEAQCVQGIIQTKSAVKKDLMQLDHKLDSLVKLLDEIEEVEQFKQDEAEALKFAQTVQQAIQAMEKVFAQAGYDPETVKVDFKSFAE